MFDYLRYYFSPLLQVLTGYTLLLGGAWAWFGLATLPLLAILDEIIPRDMKERHINNRTIANLPIWFSAVAGPILYLLVAWQIGNGTYGVVESVGAILSVSWLGVIVVVPAAHELYHQRGTMRQFIGTYSQVVYFDCTRNVAHMTGHHLDVGTDQDSDTAKRGKTLYNFAPAAVVHSTMTAMRLEGDALEKRGKSRYSLSHRVWKAVIAQLIFMAAVFAVGGLLAVAYCLAGVLIARLWVETFNYFQHYGQVRVPGKPIARRHVWNHMGTITRVVAFEITNHADHHLNAYTPYYKLKPDHAAVRMPSVFTCFLSALIPPIWEHFFIKPALKEWDLNHASAEERELAREQNLAAGWPDWFNEQPAGAAA